MIIIPGRPVPKQRPALSQRGRKAYLYTPERTRTYEGTVNLLARQQKAKRHTGPVAVSLTLYLTKGKRGDVDNYCKSILDGLNGVAYEDDRQITRLDAKVRHCRPKEQRVEIVIQEDRPCTDNEKEAHQ